MKNTKRLKSKRHSYTNQSGKSSKATLGTKYGSVGFGALGDGQFVFKEFIKRNLRISVLRVMVISGWRNIISRKYHIRHHRPIYAFLALFIIAWFESTLLNYFRIFNVKPNVILAALIILASLFSLRWSVAFAFFAGIFGDIFSVMPFGYNCLLCLLWVMLARRVYRQLHTDNSFIRLTILGLIIVLNNLSLQLLFFAAGTPASMGIFLRVVFIELILTLLLSLPMHRLFKSIFDISSLRQAF